MSDDYEDFGEFGGFGGFGRRRAYFPPLPTDIYLHGENPSNVYVPFLLDGDQRLLLKCASSIYFSSTVKTIAAGSATKLIEAPTDGYTKNLIGVDIVNTTANPVSCILYWSDNNPPTSAEIFGICGGNVAANSLWSWRGQLILETKSIWGLAGSASALRAYFSLAAVDGSYR